MVPALSVVPGVSKIVSKNYDKNLCVHLPSSRIRHPMPMPETITPAVTERDDNQSRVKQVILLTSDRLSLCLTIMHVVGPIERKVSILLLLDTALASKLSCPRLLALRRHVK